MCRSLCWRIWRAVGTSYCIRLRLNQHHLGQHSCERPRDSIRPDRRRPPEGLDSLPLTPSAALSQHPAPEALTLRGWETGPGWSDLAS